MRLKNFTPYGNQILAKVKTYNVTKSGLIHNVRPERDMFAEVLAVGPTSENVKIGDFVMFGEVSLMHFPFEDNEGKEIECVLANSFQVLGIYNPEEDEDRIFVPKAPVESPLPEGVKMEGDDMLGDWAEDQGTIN